MRTSTTLGVLLGVALPSQPLVAQPDSSARPRVGLVLSGGGARGCAHVGVLKVLEELQIPIDYVVGTSMGSIVGGLYAYGLAPDRLEAELVRAGSTRPWSLLLQDQSPRALRSLRRKKDEYGYLVDIGLGYHDGGVHLQKGLYQGQNLELELATLALQAHALPSFDALPIPFRAVAVDLRDGHEVVLQSGNLARAMRASMSLPGVFAPAVIDGRELLDGGLVRNVPIEEARALGAERLIVVDIGTPVVAEAVDSALGVSSQMVQILTQQNVDRSLVKLRAGDVLIRPELGDITSADFERAAESIRIGEAAARAVVDQLRPLVDAKAFAAFVARQRRPIAPIVVSAVEIEDTAGSSEDVIRSHIHVRAGEVLDLEQLREDLERVYGLGQYQRVGFELLPASGGAFMLVVRAEGKAWGPTLVRFGIALGSDLQGGSSFDLGAQATTLNLDAAGSEWRTGIQIGDRSGIEMELYRPIHAGSPIFVAPRTSWSLSESHASFGTIDVRAATLGADLGWTLGTWGELRLGYTWLDGEVDVRDSIVTVPGFDFVDATLDATLLVDTTDDADFPSFGVRGVLTYSFADKGLGADVDYQQFRSGAVGFASLGRTTAGLVLRYETAQEDPLPTHRRSFLGGLANLSGVEPGVHNGPHMGLFGLIVRHRLAGRHTEKFGFPLYLGGTVEFGNTWEDRDDVFRELQMAGSVFLSVDTPIGPAYLAYGLAEGGEDSYYFYVGQILR